MKIHLTEKTLSRIKIDKKKGDINLNLGAYDIVGTSLCSHCLLKSSDRDESINITQIIFGKECSCYLKKLYKNKVTVRVLE